MRAQHRPPEGVNFSSDEEVSAKELSDSLKIVASFLQDFVSTRGICRFDDWWEHDGLHFLRGQSTIHGLFECVSSPEALLSSMPGDQDVFVAFSSDENSWYLRFYLSWTESGQDLVGRFDLTLEPPLADIFRKDVLSKVACKLTEENSRNYFERIIL